MRRNQQGIVLLTVLLLIVVLTLAAGGMVQMYQTQTRREKEQQLLFSGDQIRRAIASYYNMYPAGAIRQLPQNLEVLLADPRTSPPRQHLRQIYLDPVTGKADWILVSGPTGIIGVHSSSTSPPLKITGFAPMYKSFEGASTYAGWVFKIDVP